MSTPSPSPATASPTPLAALGEERFVSLTTFRKSGAAVSTPVWIAPYGDELVVTTPAGSGKVKRLRNDDRVQLRACNRFGAVVPGTAAFAGRAEVLGHDVAQPERTTALRRKYGLEYRAIVALEGLHRRRRGHSSERLILRITPA
jgi:uncharacterized protein